MPSALIPASINGVFVEFNSGVNRSVDPRLIEALTHCIRRDIASGYTLDRIWISSANDSHQYPSRHVVGKAADISRINGVKMAVGYPADAQVKAITDAIQDTFETYAHRRENFGPKFKRKLGNQYNVSGHKDHVHISVN